MYHTLHMCMQGLRVLGYLGGTAKPAFKDTYSHWQPEWLSCHSKAAPLPLELLSKRLNEVQNTSHNLPFLAFHDTRPKAIHTHRGWF